MNAKKQEQLSLLRRFICTEYGITVEMFTSSRRTEKEPPLVPARRDFCITAYELIKGVTYTEIASFIRKNHTAVLNHIKNHKHWKGVDAEYTSHYNYMTEICSKALKDEATLIVSFVSAKRELEVFGGYMKLLLPELSEEIQGSIDAHSFNLQSAAK